MKTKHTPGPWWVKASPENAQERLINAGKEPVLGYENWDGLAVVYGSYDDQENGLIVMEANAKLIAAAPDLLEALQILASIPIEDFGKESKPDYPLMAWNGTYLKVSDVLKARAAIKKATE